MNGGAFRSVSVTRKVHEDIGIICLMKKIRRDDSGLEIEDDPGE
jgi:hypothetical protein